jgi:uncharacterized membrane protein
VEERFAELATAIALGVEVVGRYRQLGAIAAIRTFLNYFLEKDLEQAEESGEAPGPVEA